MPKAINQDDLGWLLERAEPPADKLPPAAKWYRIEAATKSRRASVYIMDEISPWGSGARAFAEQVAGLDVDQLDLHINSLGGQFAEGIAIMNMLRQHKATVLARVEGVAASAASLVALGADTVVMAKGSQMMIHEGQALMYGFQEDMLKAAAILEKTNAQMAELYAEKAGGTAAEWRDAMRAETWYTDQEAVEAGLADTLDATANEDEVVAARTKWDLSVFAHAGRDKAPAPYTPTAPPPVNDNKEGERMPNKYLVQVATRAGVKDADKFEDDEKLSKAIEDAEAAAKAKVDAEGKGKVGDKPGDEKPGEGDQPQGVPSVKLPDGFALVDKSTLEALQASGHRADAMIKRVEARERDAELDRAIEKGKIPAARREHWQSYWDKDKEGAVAALAALPDNLVPVAPIGAGGGAGDDEVDADYRALYPDEG